MGLIRNSITAQAAPIRAAISLTTSSSAGRSPRAIRSHNSWPIGTATATKVITAGRRTFDLWEGFNSGAGYYVYTFIPTGTASQPTLKTSGSLNVDAKPFLIWLQNNRAKGGRCNNSMYLHAAEAAFEVVRGNGWAKVSATMDVK